MDLDIMFVGGLLLGVLSLPAIISRAIEGRFPRLGVLMLLVCGGLVGYVVSKDSTHYSFDQIPDAVIRVFGYIFN